MKRLIATAIESSLLFFLVASSAFCADVVGTISDPQGHPVAGVEVGVRDSTGKVVANAISDAQGHYTIRGLSPDTYNYTLDPLGTRFKSGTVVSHLDSSGLTVDWKVSQGSNALAMATAGSGAALAGDPFGLSMGEFASVVMLGTAVVAGGVVGGVSASGGFSSSGSATPTSSPPSSSSM